MRMITSKYYSFDLDNEKEKKEAVKNTFMNFLDLMEKARISPTENQKRFANITSSLQYLQDCQPKINREEMYRSSPICQIIKSRFEFSLNSTCTQFVSMTIEDCVKTINPGIASMIVSYIAYKCVKFSIIENDTKNKKVFSMKDYLKVVGSENTMSFDRDKLNECWEAQKMHRKALDNISDNLVDYFDFEKIVKIFQPELEAPKEQDINNNKNSKVRTIPLTYKEAELIFYKFRTKRYRNLMFHNIQENQKIMLLNSAYLQKYKKASYALHGYDKDDKDILLMIETIGLRKEDLKGFFL